MLGFYVRSPALETTMRKVEYTDRFLFLYLVFEMNKQNLKSIACLFFSDCSITKFLNRILGLEVHKQNHLFQYFTDNFDYLIEKDKKEGKYDMGILGMEIKCNSKIEGCQWIHSAAANVHHFLLLCRWQTLPQVTMRFMRRHRKLSWRLEILRMARLFCIR